MVLSYTPGRNFPSSQNKKNPFFYPSLKNNDKKKSALKKFLIFLKKAFLTFQESELSNIFLKKFFLFFWKWNFLALRIKISGRNFLARKIKKTLTKFLIYGEMELSSHKLKELLYFRRELAMSENQTKKSPPKRFFVSYVFTIFTVVKPR